jgi:hypothetical protein
MNLYHLSLDVYFEELLHKKQQRFFTQDIFKLENLVIVAFMAGGKGNGRNMSNL